MDTKSYWVTNASLPRFPKIPANLAVDVVVVGGGITGITAAYLLKKEGASVALLERGRCAAIDTGHTTAHLTSVTDLRLGEISKTFGREAARAVWDAGGAAIDQIVSLIRAEAIKCDFRWVPGYLHVPLQDPSASKLTELRQEETVARALGLRAVFEDKIPGLGVPGIRFPHQAIFHPIKYLSALLRQIEGGGSHVFENSAADEVSDSGRAVKCGDFRIKCRYVILATHNPLMGNTGTFSAALFQTKLALYTSYAVGARLPVGAFPEASFWDTGDPYYYLRVERRRGYDYAIFGGEDHKTGQASDTEAVYRKLGDKFRAIAPAAQIDHRWSGQVIETNDGLPFIGETGDHQFAATGYSGNGMTFGTLAAMMAVDAFKKRQNPWADLFEIHRKKLRGGTWSYLKENKDYPYYLIRNWLAKDEGDAVTDLKKGDGRILSLEGRKVAAYRDASGHVSLCSPVCTHLQCIVDWNNAEKTWDCPCHGSRFKPTGEVISGPAEEPLSPVNEKGEKTE